MSGLKVAGDALVAEVDQVDPALQELVKAGRYKKISASFYRPDAPRNPTPGRWHLRHVGFLGAQPPAVKGLRAVRFADGDDDGVINFECPAKEATMTDLHKREADLAERERKLRRREAAAFAEGLVKEGRLPPGHRPQVLDLLERLDDHETVEFGEGDDTVSRTVAEHLRELLRTLPVAIELRELAAPDGATAVVNSRDPVALAAAALAFVEAEQQVGRKISAATAVRRVLGQR